LLKVEESTSMLDWRIKKRYIISRQASSSYRIRLI
jgi:hypothetical protein